MAVVRGTLNNGETVPFQQKFHGFTSSLLGVVLKKLEKVFSCEVFVKVLLSSAVVVDCSKGHAFFVYLPPVNFLLNCANCEQSVHDNIALLPNSENSVNGLVVVCWVPIWV